MYRRPSDVQVFIHERNRVGERIVSRNGFPRSSVKARGEQSEDRLLPRHLKCVRRLEGDGGHFFTFKMAPSRLDQSKPHLTQGSCYRAQVSAKPTEHVVARIPSMPGLSCPETALASRYSALFGFEALELNPLGNWIRYAWKHVREDTCLDDALEYTYMSMLSFRRRDAGDDLQTCLKRRKALSSLQAAVDCASEPGENDNLVVAVMLHYAAEVRVGVFHPPD